MSKWNWSEVAPDTEDTWRRLTSVVLEVIRQDDSDALAAQRSRMSPEIAAKVTEATYSLQNRFRYWEELIRSMENDWCLRGRYFIDEYINNLDSRDSIDRTLATLPAMVEDALLPLLRELDQRFYQRTTHDDGMELHPWVSRLREGVQLNERWYRKPCVIPWS